MESVSNTTVLILLSKVHRFDLLQNMFTNIFIPSAVEKEFIAGGSLYPSSILHFQKYSKTLYTTENPKIEKSFPLGLGESSAISLALEKKIVFLSDDKRARTIAQVLGVAVLGTPGIILWNVQHKYLTALQAKDIIHQLL